jgi:hypothetical protein
MREIFGINLKSFSKSMLFEFLFFFILLLFSYLLREKPSSFLEERIISKGYYKVLFNSTSKNSTSEKSQEKPSEKFNSTLSLNYTQIFKRNPFTPEGSYYPVPIPEIPFTLIAVKTSPPPTKAILRSFTGEFLIVKKGDKLFDGSKVVEVKENAVILERLGKKRELKVFSVEVERWKPKKSF